MVIAEVIAFQLLFVRNLGNMKLLILVVILIGTVICSPTFERVVQEKDDSLIKYTLTNVNGVKVQLTVHEKYIQSAIKYPDDENDGSDMVLFDLGNIEGFVDFTDPDFKQFAELWNFDEIDATTDTNILRSSTNLKIWWTHTFKPDVSGITLEHDHSIEKPNLPFKTHAEYELKDDDTIHYTLKMMKNGRTIVQGKYVFRKRMSKDFIVPETSKTGFNFVTQYKLDDYDFVLNYFHDSHGTMYQQINKDLTNDEVMELIVKFKKTGRLPVNGIMAIPKWK